jgi:hypothetical protein
VPAQHPFGIYQRDDGWSLQEDMKTSADYAHHGKATRRVVNMAHAVGV